MSNAPYNYLTKLKEVTYYLLYGNCTVNMMIHFGFWPAASPAWAPCTISRILIHRTCCLLDEGTSTHPWTHWGRFTFFNNPHEDLLSSHTQTCTESRCKPYQSAFGLSNHSKEHAFVQYEAPLQGSGKHIKVGPINVACCLVHFVLPEMYICWRQALLSWERNLQI